VRFPLIIALSLLASTCAALPPDLLGHASIIDGDTLEIHGTRIRLFGIDAPESNHLSRNADSDLYRCGQRAANAVSDFIANRPVACVEIDRDRHGRSEIDGNQRYSWIKNQRS
jgi:endonuclease YncB( thermonuclease family)